MSDEDRRRLERALLDGDDEARVELATLASRDHAGWLYVWDLPAGHDRPLPGSVRVDLFDMHEDQLRSLNRTSRGMWAFYSPDLRDLFASLRASGQVARGWIIDMSTGFSIETANTRQLEVPIPREFSENQEATLAELLEETIWARGGDGVRDIFGIEDLRAVTAESRILGEDAPERPVWVWARSTGAISHGGSRPSFFVLVVRDVDAVTVAVGRGASAAQCWEALSICRSAHEHPVNVPLRPGRFGPTFEAYASQPDVPGRCGGCGAESGPRQLEERAAYYARMRTWARRHAQDRVRMTVDAARRFARVGTGGHG